MAHYPTVLSMLNDRLDWTTALGQAYVNQSTDIMMSVQRLRNMAHSQGNLVTTPQQQVVVDRGYIQIVPAQPRVIFVPAYDPGVIYVQRVYRPGFGFDGFFNFGTGFVIGSWLNYDMDWGTHRVVYNSWDERGGWRERSRPYVHITNVYVNNRYENVNLNRNVVHRHVDYDNVQRYNSVHHDVTYKNRERIEATRVRSEQRRVGQQRRQQSANEKVNDRENDHGFRTEHPDNARFERPNQAPPNAEQRRPQPANEKVNDRENDHGYRGQPSSQGQPAARQHPNNASFERPNQAPPTPASRQTRPTGEQMNDRENDRNMRNQPLATPAARTAPQPNQAAPAAHGAHPAAKNQPKVQQQQHGVDKKSKDKKEDKK